MRCLSPSFRNIKIAANAIKNGGLVIFPTETVYGLGANALNPVAVSKIFEVKKRPRFDPLIVHIADFSMLKYLCKDISFYAKKLIQKFWPGPLTLIFQKKDIVPDIVTSGLETVAIRMPSHLTALSLIKESSVPIAAPSANLFGQLSPTSVKHIKKEIRNKVDVILNGGECSIGIESTVVKVKGDTAFILRPGATEIEKIKRIIKKVKVVNRTPQTPDSPGQLPSHYSPSTPLKIIDSGKIPSPGDKKIGLLAFKEIKEKDMFDAVEVLSRSGDIREAAQNFFSCLHRLDISGVDIIYAEKVPEKGLGYAIMDRLRKAEHHK